MAGCIICYFLKVLQGSLVGMIVIVVIIVVASIGLRRVGSDWFLHVRAELLEQSPASASGT